MMTTLTTRAIAVLVCFQTVLHMGAIAQSLGDVRILVQPQAGLQYIVDGKERLHGPTLKLPAGTHRLTFWAPNRTLFDTIVTVVADSTLMLRKVMPATAEYRAFADANRRVSQQKFFIRALPVLTTGACAWMMVRANKDRLDAEEALKASEASYAGLRSPASIQSLKEVEIPARQEDLDQAHQRTIVWSVVTGAALAGTIWCFHKAAGIERPGYEDREKVRFDGIAWMPGPLGGCYASVSLPIQ